MAVRQEKNKSKWTKDGRSWYFDTYYINEFGEKKEKKSKLFKLKREAEDAERIFLNNIDNNYGTNSSKSNNKISFEYSYYDWLEFKKATLKEPSYVYIKTILNKWIYKKFKYYEDINKITSEKIIEWKNELNKECSSTEYRNKIIGYLKEYLEYCFENFGLDKKLFLKLQFFKITTRSKKNDAEWNFWTYDQFQYFLPFVDNEFYKLVYSFLYYTGLRIGEMIALKWRYVNLEKKYIRVEFSFTNNLEDKPFGFVDPKTENSIRIVELDDELLEQLKKHYQSERKIYGFNEDYLVFGNVKHIAPTTFRRYLYKYIEKANIKKITPHGFRHSHVSLLINLGCDSRDVAERIGDTVEVVEKTYYHMFPEKKKVPTNKLNELKLRGNYEVTGIQVTKKAENSAFYT